EDRETVDRALSGGRPDERLRPAARAKWSWRPAESAAVAALGKQEFAAAGRVPERLCPGILRDFQTDDVRRDRDLATHAFISSGWRRSPVSARGRLSPARIRRLRPGS